MTAGSIHQTGTAPTLADHAQDEDGDSRWLVTGRPTPSELAAVVAVLRAAVADASATPPGGTPAPARASGWGDPGRRLRAPLQPGPWHSSGRR